jgi:hypothetical protein
VARPSERWLPWLSLAAALGLALLVYARRADKGDTLPAFSSWRADPAGTGALYEALPAMGVQTRRLTRVDFDLRSGLPDTGKGVVLRLGQSAYAYNGRRDDSLNGVLEFAREGGLVIVAFRSMPGGLHVDEEEEEEEEGAEEEETATSVSPTAQALSPTAQATSATAQALSPSAKPEEAGRSRRWENWNWGLSLPGLEVAHAELGQRWAQRDAALPGLPELLPVRERGAFKLIHPSWRVLYHHVGGPVVVTRAYGKGRLVAFANGYCFTNEGLRERPPGAWLAPLLEGRTLAVFDERGLGVYESPGLNEVSVRLGLGPLYAVLGLLALLWLWRRLAPLLAREDRPQAEQPASAGGQLSALLRAQGSPAVLLERLWRDAQARPEAPLRRRQAAGRLYEAWAAKGKPSAEARTVYQKMSEILTRGEKHG